MALFNKEIKGKPAEIINYLFQSLLVTYLILLLIEQIWKGSVNIYLNLNYLLIAVIIIGILDVFSEHKKTEDKKPKKIDYLFSIILGILGFIIIKIKTGDLGWLSWLISSIAGILIILLSFIILEEDSEENKVPEKEIKVNKKDCISIILISISVLFIISSLIFFFSSLGFPESLRIIYGSVYVLFLPGFLISFIFFPKTKISNNPSEREDKSIDLIERIALSFALSIAIVPLVIFYLNLAGMKINLISSSLTILGIIIISSFVLYFKTKKSKNLKNQ